MREIIKNSQPKSLTEYKKEKDASYDNLPKKVREDLKESLLASVLMLVVKGDHPPGMISDMIVKFVG